MISARTDADEAKRLGRRRCDPRVKDAEKKEADSRQTLHTASPRGSIGAPANSYAGSKLLRVSECCSIGRQLNSDLNSGIVWCALVRPLPGIFRDPGPVDQPGDELE